jgi:quercetin dioxygenase-like cupin family protein
MRRLFLFKAVFIICFISLIFILCQKPALAQRAIGKLSAFKGEVELVREGRSIPLNPNMLIVPKDRIKVEEGTAEVTFSDESTIRIRPHTDITLDQRKKKRKLFGLWSKTYLSRLINIIKGTVSGNIKKSKTLVTEFETPSLVAAVRGTTLSFGFNPDTGQAELRTDAGEILAFSPDGWSTFTLSTGESVRVYWDSATGSTSIATLSGEVDVTSGNTTTTVQTGDAISTNVNPDTGAASVTATAGTVEVTVGETTITVETGDAIAANVDPDTGVATVSTTAGEVEVTSGGVTITVSEGQTTTAAPDEPPAPPVEAPPAEAPPAEPYVPPEAPGAEVPMPDEPPIQDTEPASPV